MTRGVAFALRSLTSGEWTPATRWVALVALSLAIGLALNALRLPAALLLGPMIAAVALAAAGRGVSVPTPAFVAAQGVIGLMIAGFLPLSVGGEMAGRWPIFLVGTLSTMVAASLLGWLLARSRVLPGTTAIWGSSPGAATIMTIMSEHYGADLRLVALMQYLRVACCAAAAALMARALGVPSGAQGVSPNLAALDWTSVVETLVVAFGGAFVGGRLGIAGGAMLVPMAVGFAGKATGLLSVELPIPVLALCYALLGWSIGSRFTPDVLRHAARVLPRLIISIVSLIAVCGAFGMALVPIAGVDPLTAFLATSPGGMDSATIIAATTKVDTPFVIAMQVARFFVVMFTAPAVARLLSRSAEPLPADGSLEL